MGNAMSCNMFPGNDDSEELTEQQKLFNRQVTINQNEIVVAKLMVQRDRLQSRIQKLDQEER